MPEFSPIFVKTACFRQGTKRSFSKMTVLTTPIFFRKLEKAVAVRNSCWKGFPANFDTAGKLFPDFLAAQNAIPAKVWALSGNTNGCWKIGPAFGNAAGFSPPRPPQPSWVFLNFTCFGLFLKIASKMPCKTRITWPFSGLFFDFMVIFDSVNIWCIVFFLSWSPSFAADNHGAWIGRINCLAARNWVLNFPLFL